MLATKTATPVEIRPFGQPDNFGNSSFEIKFDDGTGGRYSVRATTQDYFVVGTPVDYMYDATRVSKVGKPDPWIKRMDAQQYQQGHVGGTPFPQTPTASFAPLVSHQPPPTAPFAPPVYNQPPMPQVPVQGNRPLPTQEYKLSAEAKKQKMISASVIMSLVKDFVVAGTINLLSPEFGQYYKVMNDTVQKEIDRIDKL